MPKKLHKCNKCKRNKPISDFYLTKAKSGKLYPRSRCKHCYNAASIKAFKLHPEWLCKMQQRRKQKRASAPFRLDTVQALGLTVEQAFEIYNAQKGRCAICEKPPKDTRLALDHNHATGKPRQFLCAGCNGDLGVLENGEHLKKLQDYLEKHRRS
jgi:hypothetical protein